MNLNKFAILVVTLASACAVSFAQTQTPGPSSGAFGVRQGMTAAELGAIIKLTKSRPMVFTSDTAPEPHPLFVTYRYVIGEDTGLCKVSALSKDVQSNVFGDGIKEEFKELSDALIQKYGPATFAFDRLQRGSLWTRPEDFMMGLLREDRELSATWFRGTVQGVKNSARLPNSIDSIELQAIAASTQSANIMIAYSFNNNDACVEQMRKRKNRGL